MTEFQKLNLALLFPSATTRHRENYWKFNPAGNAVGQIMLTALNCGGNCWLSRFLFEKFRNIFAVRTDV
jgi:hypothetical protein